MANEVTFEIRKIYLKDASLESPQAPEVFLSMEESPEIDIDLGIEHKKLNEDKYHEVVLRVSVNAKSKDKTSFLCEVQQGGVFFIDGIPDEELELALNIACPNVLLPFARECISDLVTKAGFPQLLLAPVNFESIYQQMKEQKQKDQQNQKKAENNKH
jgi:preprotein translocase subunit SecB